MFFPLALIVIGGAFLLQNLGVIPANAWDFIWPGLIILFGISMLAGKKKSGWCNWCGCGEKEDDQNQ